jgi:hypothetical protein
MDTKDYREEVLDVKDNDDDRSIGTSERSLNSGEDRFDKPIDIPVNVEKQGEYVSVGNEKAGGEFVDSELVGVYKVLKRTLKTLDNLKYKEYTLKDITRVQNRLRFIDGQYKQGAFRRHGTIPQGQAIVAELLEQAHEVAHEMLCALPDETEGITEEQQQETEADIIAMLDRIIAPFYKDIFELIGVLDGMSASKENVRLSTLTNIQERLRRFGQNSMDFMDMVTFHEELLAKFIASANMSVIDLLERSLMEKETDFNENVPTIQSQLKSIVEGLNNLNHDEALREESLSTVTRKLTSIERQSEAQAAIAILLNEAHNLLQTMGKWE